MEESFKKVAKLLIDNQRVIPEYRLLTIKVCYHDLEYYTLNSTYLNRKGNRIFVSVKEKPGGYYLLQYRTRDTKFKDVDNVTFYTIIPTIKSIPERLGKK